MSSTVCRILLYHLYKAEEPRDGIWFWTLLHSVEAGGSSCWEIFQEFVILLPVLVSNVFLMFSLLYVSYYCKLPLLQSQRQNLPLLPRISKNCTCTTLDSYTVSRHWFPVRIYLTDDIKGCVFGFQLHTRNSNDSEPAHSLRSSGTSLLTSASSDVLGQSNALARSVVFFNFSVIFS